VAPWRKHNGLNQEDKMGRNLFGVAMVSLLSVFLSGCQLAPTFTAQYKITSDKLLQPPRQGTLAVSRFTESRPPRQYTSAGKLFMVYVPLIPYVSFPYERMDETVKKISDDIATRGGGMRTIFGPAPVAPKFEAYSYPLSFARTVAEDLNESGLFQKVVFTDQDVITDSEQYPYHLSGQISESPFRRSATSYCLGLPGVLLWFLPIPMAKITGGVTVELTLTDTRTHQVIWTQKIEKEITRYITLYTSSAMIYGRSGAFSLNVEPPPGDSQVDDRSLFSWNFEALRRGVAEAKPAIARALMKAK
jgi:hypothetical protein